MAKVPNAVKIAENYHRLSRVHERYSRTDRQTDGRAFTFACKIAIKSKNQSYSGAYCFL